MAALVGLNAAKCPSCKIVLLRPVPGSTYQMLCPACGYHSSPKQSRLLSLLPTVEVTDTSKNPAGSIGNIPATSTSSISNMLSHSLHRRQNSAELDNAGSSSCSSSSNSSPTHPSSWLALPPVTPVTAFPLGMGHIRRHSCQLLDGQSASTPSRYDRDCLYSCYNFIARVKCKGI